MRLAAAQPFDGGDLLARCVLGGSLARTHRDAVEMHGAGAAQACPAAEFGAGHLQLLADDPEQRRVVGRVDRRDWPLMVSVIMFPPWLWLLS